MVRPDDPVRWMPFNDGYGIVGWSWYCVCGKNHQFVSHGDTMPCGFVIPDIDPEDWYDAEMKKPVNDRAWNLRDES